LTLTPTDPQPYVVGRIRREVEDKERGGGGMEEEMLRERGDVEMVFRERAVEVCQRGSNVVRERERERKGSVVAGGRECGKGVVVD
jgi:hypothetical protein